MSEAEHQWWQTDENDEVATKPELWRPLSRAVGGFDLDPAAGCEPTPIAAERYTLADDGLSQPWHGTVWLNPPFSEKGQWYRKLADEYWNGDVDRAVAIARDGTSAEWFQDWFSTADTLCFLGGRQWYTDKGSPTFSTIVGAWNPTEDLISTFHDFGTVVDPKQVGGQATL